MKDRDLLLNTDVADSIQGHVGPNTKQVFETLTGVPFSQPKLNLAGYEFVMRDQFGNYYHKMRAVLFDGELYDTDTFIKPSMMTKHGGGWAHFEDRWAKQHLRITETLLKELREQGALALARANIEILKGRQNSTTPVAIETKDITHAANKLEDALTSEDRLADAVKAAKEAQGEVVKEETTPVGFAPVAQKADLIQFPDLTPKAPGPTTEP